MVFDIPDSSQASLQHADYQVVESASQASSAYETIILACGVPTPVLSSEKLKEHQNTWHTGKGWIQFSFAMAKETLTEKYHTEKGPCTGGIREGHDFTHAARVEALALAICNHLPDNQKLDEEQIALLRLAALCQRSGRTLEGLDALCSERSAEIFKYYALHLGVKEPFIEDYAQAISSISHPSNPLPTAQAEKIKNIITSAHKFDLVRCFKLKKEVVFQSLSPLFQEKTESVFNELRVYARNLCAATGRLMTDLDESTPGVHLVSESLGKKCSHDLEFCLKQIQTVPKPAIKLRSRL